MNNKMKKMKNISKEKKLKNELVELREELSNEVSKNRRLQGQLDEKERTQKDIMFRFDVFAENEKENTRRLQEIIRWLINPESTKDPFNHNAERKLEKELRGF
jgi:hypothetical protein